MCNTKREYYELLGRARVAISSALQETWGIAMLEALFSGCVPLVPDRLSYHEMYPIHFRYRSLPDCADLLTFVLTEPDKYDKILHDTQERHQYNGKMAIQNMVEVLSQ